jgi:hypothetical protein
VGDTVLAPTRCPAAEWPLPAVAGARFGLRTGLSDGGIVCGIDLRRIGEDAGSGVPIGQLCGRAAADRGSV